MPKPKLVPFDPCKHMDFAKLKAIAMQLRVKADEIFADACADDDDDPCDLQDLARKIERYVTNTERDGRTPDDDDWIIDEIKEFHMEHYYQILVDETDD